MLAPIPTLLNKLYEVLRLRRLSTYRTLKSLSSLPCGLYSYIHHMLHVPPREKYIFPQEKYWQAMANKLQLQEHCHDASRIPSRQGTHVVVKNLWPTRGMRKSRCIFLFPSLYYIFPKLPPCGAECERMDEYQLLARLREGLFRGPPNQGSIWIHLDIYMSGLLVHFGLFWFDYWVCKSDARWKVRLAPGTYGTYGICLLCSRYWNNCSMLNTVVMQLINHEKIHVWC